uniref:hypothetical protein n=1 Tax=Salmonella enterica TaxID=28901 RepID=UPI001FF705A5|nr:hypothetical protein [Salmonella enterica]
MRAWARHAGEWSEWHGDWCLQRLDQAAAAVCFAWPGEKHRALADALACRAVWQYLNDDDERQRVEAVRLDRQRGQGGSASAVAGAAGAGAARP